METGIITCPHCETRAEASMPTNACVYFYDCPGCGTRLKPHRGDCCVFCSFGDTPCPPIRAEQRAPTDPAQLC